MHIRLFERPAHGLRMEQGDMAIEGILPTAIAGQSYEGRLDIINAIGDCTVELASGSLPPGSTVYVDNDTKQIVITWPAHQSGDVPIANGGFESGGADGWELGVGWGVTNDNATEGTYTLVYANNGGESVATSTTRAAVSPGTSVTASCDVRQGASSSGNAGAGIFLEFRDAAGRVLEKASGNLITQGENNESKVSSVTRSAPAGASTVNLGVLGFRKRQNREVWADNFSWNLQRDEVGTNVEGEWCIGLLATDSNGRQATWEGCIQVRVTGTRWLASDAGSGVYMADDPINGPWASHSIPEKGGMVGVLPMPARNKAILYPAGSDAIGNAVLVDASDPDNLTAEVLPAFRGGTIQFSKFYPGIGGGPDIVVQTSRNGSSYSLSTDLGRTFATYNHPITSNSLLRNVLRMADGRWLVGGANPTDWHGLYSDAALPTDLDWNNATDTVTECYNAVLLDVGASVMALEYGTSIRMCARTGNGSSWDAIASTGYLPSGTNVNLGSDVRCTLDWTGRIAIFSEGQNGGLLITTDRGATWTRVLVPGMPVTMFEADGIVIVNTTAGVYVSQDLGATFSLLPSPPGVTLLSVCPLAPGDSSGGIWN